MQQITVYIAMQHRNMKQAAARFTRKGYSCVVRHFRRWIRDSTNDGNFLAIYTAASCSVIWLLSAKYGNMLWHFRCQTQSVKRIVVAMNQEHVNPVLTEFFERFLKSQLSL